MNHRMMMLALGLTLATGCSQPDTTTYTTPDTPQAAKADEKTPEELASDEEVAKLAKIMEDVDAMKNKGKGAKAKSKANGEGHETGKTAQKTDQKTAQKTDQKKDQKADSKAIKQAKASEPVDGKGHSKSNGKALDKADGHARTPAQTHTKPHAQAHGDVKKSDQKTGHVSGSVSGHKPMHKPETNQPKSAARQMASVPGKSMVYIVQVGAFRVKENADKLQERLKGEGFPVTIRSMNHSKNGALHLVRLEPTPNRVEAQKWVGELKEKTELDANILAQPDAE